MSIGGFLISIINALETKDVTEEQVVKAIKDAIRNDKPEWLSQGELDAAIFMWNEGQRVDATQYLRHLAAKHIDHPYPWAVKFLTDKML